jgi:hypothetical protein
MDRAEIYRLIGAQLRFDGFDVRVCVCVCVPHHCSHVCSDAQRQALAASLLQQVPAVGGLPPPSAELSTRLLAADRPVSGSLGVAVTGGEPAGDLAAAAPADPLSAAGFSDADLDLSRCIGA